MGLTVFMKKKVSVCRQNGNAFHTTLLVNHGESKRDINNKQRHSQIVDSGYRGHVT